MTIPSTPRKAGPFLGNGATTSFPFAFKVFGPTDIKVVVADSAGVETVLALNSDYAVTLNPNQDTSPGGIVTYPLGGSSLPPGSTLSIIGDIDYDQPLDLPSGGNFSPLALENQLDRTTMQIQQLAEIVGRSVSLPVTANASTQLPAPEADKFLAWNSTGTALVNADAVGGSIDGPFLLLDNVIGSDFAIPAGKNALSISPAIAPGVTVAVPPGSEWVILDSSINGGGGGGGGSNLIYETTATTGQTTFTLSTGYIPGKLLVFLNGVLQQASAYIATDGTTVTFNSPLAGGDEVKFIINLSPLTAPAPGSGEANTASNLGGVGLFAGKVGVDLRFKGLAAGPGVSLSSDASTVTISSTTSGGGEANTASNLGGVGLFANKVGVDLRFKGLAAGPGVTLSSDANTVTISATTTGGEANTASNLGGVGLFANKVGVDLRFKGLAAGQGVTLSSDANTVTIRTVIISATDPGAVGPGVIWVQP